MPNYLATVTYDLHNASAEDYHRVHEQLRSVGLSSTLLSSSGVPTHLPETTVAGEFAGVDGPAVRNHVSTSVSSALRICNVTGRFFVAVGSDWAWAIE